MQSAFIYVNVNSVVVEIIQQSEELARQQLAVMGPESRHLLQRTELQSK